MAYGSLYMNQIKQIAEFDFQMLRIRIVTKIEDKRGEKIAILFLRNPRNELQFVCRILQANYQGSGAEMAAFEDQKLCDVKGVKKEDPR